MRISMDSLPDEYLFEDGTLVRGIAARTLLAQDAALARLALVEGAAREVVKECEGDGIKWPSVRALAALLPPPSPSTEEPR